MPQRFRKIGFTGIPGKYKASIKVFFLFWMTFVLTYIIFIIATVLYMKWVSLILSMFLGAVMGYFSNNIAESIARSWNENK